MISFKKIDIQKLPIQKLFIVALSIILIFSIRSCRLKEVALNDKGLELNFYQSKNQEITKEKNKLGEDVASQKLLLITRDKDLEKQLLANSNLTKINSHYQAKLSTVMTNVSAAYIRDTIHHYVVSAKFAKDSLPDTTQLVVVGTKFIKVDEWYTVKGSIQKGGINFDTLSIFNNPKINIGYKRKSGFKGYFQKQEKTIEIINPNPYTSTIGISNVNFKAPEPRFYETKIFNFGLGVLATIFGGAILNK